MAKKNKRVSREEVDSSEYNLLEPLDIFSFGTENDPCFGKLHDLKAPECIDCGDSEFCAIVQAQNLRVKQLEIEAKQRFKDIEESGEVMITKKEKALKLLTKYKGDNMRRLKSILRVSRELNLSKDIVKDIYNQI